MKSSRVAQMVKGSIDMHVHAGPDPFRERRVDALQLAIQAKEAGMRAVVLKCHFYATAPLAYLLNKVVSDVLTVGSMTLNEAAGGLSPRCVEVSAKLGAKVIWMPTFSSVPDSKKRGEGAAISLLDEEGRLVPQMMPILQIIKENDLVLATGHISVAELFAVTDEAIRLGIKVVITHPLTKSFGSPLTIKQQQDLVGKGAYIEHCFVTCMPSFEGLDPKIMVGAIKAVGAEHCVMSTDLGQPSNPLPIEGMRMMVETMSKWGLSEQEMELLIKANPSRLLNLD